MAAAGGAAYHNYAHILAAIQDKKLNCQLEDVSRQFGMISLQVIALRPDHIMSIVKHTLVFLITDQAPNNHPGHQNSGFS